MRIGSTVHNIPPGVSIGKSNTPTQPSSSLLR